MCARARVHARVCEEGSQQKKFLAEGREMPHEVTKAPGVEHLIEPPLGPSTWVEDRSNGLKSEHEPMRVQYSFMCALSSSCFFLMLRSPGKWPLTEVSSVASGLSTYLIGIGSSARYPEVHLFMSMCPAPEMIALLPV